LPATAGEPAIWEAYRPGTEPGQDRDRGLQTPPGEVVAGDAATGDAATGDAGAGDPAAGAPVRQTPAGGTGGLY
jgi:hypothetical protein